MYLICKYVYLSTDVLVRNVCVSRALLQDRISLPEYTRSYVHAARVCTLDKQHVYNEQRGVCVYTRTTRREIRIIGSNDGSQGTGAGKSQRLSLLVTHHSFSSLFVSVPFLSLSLFIFLLFFFFFLVATLTQRGKNSRGYAEDSHRDPCFRRSCFERACTPCRFSSLRLFVRPIALFTALPGQSQVRKSRLRRNARAGGGESSLLAAAPLAVLRPSIARSRSAVRYVLPFPSATTRKRTSDANQSKLFYRQEDLIYNNIFLQRTSFRRSRISSLNWIYWFY